MKKERKTTQQKISKKRGSRLLSVRNKRPRTAEQYFSMSSRLQEMWNRVTHVIAKMRARNISLQKASREFGVDPRTVVRHAGPALKKSAKGRYNAKPSDLLLRVLVFPTHDGTREIAVR